MKKLHYLINLLNFLFSQDLSLLPFSISLLLCISLTQCPAQNLIPNPSFELINICKKFGEPCSPKGWRTTSLKLTRYNIAREQPKNLGSHSINLLLLDKARDFDRKFIQCELICPIEAGQNYQLSFYVKSKAPIATELNLRLSSEMYFAKTNKQLKDLNDFFSIPLPILKKEDTWEKVNFEFLATADATHLLIGNLKTDEQTILIDLTPKKKKVLSKKYVPQSRVEYAIDNIVLMPLDSSHTADCDLEKRLEVIFSDHIRHELFQEGSARSIPNETKPVIKKIEKPVPLPEVFSKSVNILEDVEFISNTTKLTQDSYANLNIIRNALIEFPEINIKIIGHTDEVGSALNNLNLSKARAKSIYTYLISEGIQPSRLSYDGRGETSPIAPNDNKTGRQLNRRVEIIIIK